MNESSDELRKAWGELAKELGRAVEHASRVVRDAARDPRTRPSGSDSSSDVSPVQAIRELGELRDAGLLTEDEFQAKKSELLERI